MTYLPIQLPFKGFTEQSPYSAVPEGMTPSCLNVMPTDVWNGRMRISTRTGTQVYSAGGVQFIGTYRVYEGDKLVEKVIFVRGGMIYYADPHASIPLTGTKFGGQVVSGVDTPLLNATGFVEGVQFNEHFYFVDGDHYVFVKLTTPTSATAVAVWGGGGGGGTKHGPYHTDPTTPAAGERATLICRWGARLVLAGYKRTPNIWYACEPDAPWPISGGSGGGLTDGWTGNDYIGAVSGSTYADYGTLGDPIVAVFPFAQSGLMFACSNSFSFLNNDPVFEESVAMVSLTKSIGIAGRRAWCQSQEKGAFVLANDGLYYLNPNDFNFNRANRVSAGRLDSFFLRLDFGTPITGGSGPLSGGSLRYITTSQGSGTGADSKTLDPDLNLTDEPSTDKVSVPSYSSSFTGPGTGDPGEVFPCLCYDPDREGVWMFLTVNEPQSASLHLFYDLKTDSFWPQRFSDPDIYGPTSATYVGTSRTKSGKLFLAGSASISIMDRAFPVGIDGFDEEMTQSDQIARFIRSSVTIGPVIGPLPQRLMLNEIRIDLADDEYELPGGFTDLSTKPILSVGYGDTAQVALGLQSDVLFVTPINELAIDGGSASTTTFANTYDGGNEDAPSPHYIDGRYAVRPWGQYSQVDPFASGTTRVYDGPAYWQIKFDSDRWKIVRSTTPEYVQVDPDAGNPNGLMASVVQNPISPDAIDNARVSGAAFEGAEVVEIGELVPGRNDAKRCRIRAEAMYFTVASDGRPFSLERMSAVVSQVGKSRGAP